MSVVWYPEYEFPLESTVSLLHKFMFHNSATIGETENLIGTRFTETGSNDHYQRILRHEEEIRARFWRMLGQGGQEAEFLPSRRWKLVSVPGNSHLTGMSRICPRCIKIGYHSSWHELAFFDRCFVHGCKLTTVCPNCTSSISPRFSNPNLCPNSHRILGIPSSIASHREFCEKIESSSCQLMRWHEETREKAIADGLIFAAPEKPEVETHIFKKFPRKDDVRNWNFSNQGLIGICVKLYGSDSNLALRGSAAGFEIRKNVYRTKNLQFDLKKWRENHLGPSGRYITQSKRVAAVARLLQTKVNEYLNDLLDEYDEMVFSGHAPCGSIQAQACELHRAVRLPVFCVYGYARTALREVWLLPSRMNSLDVHQYDVDERESFHVMKICGPVLERMGYLFQISDCLNTLKKNKSEIVDFVGWLAYAILRDEMEDFHEELVLTLKKQMKSQRFEFPALFSYRNPRDRAWLLEHSAKGIRLVRVSRKPDEYSNEQASLESLSHVEEVTSYYEHELRDFEDWVSSSIRRTTKLYQELLDENYEASAEYVMKRNRNHPVIKMWVP